MTTNERIADLIISHLQEKISPEERRELEAWMALSEDHREAAAAFLDKKQLEAGIRDHWVEDKIWRRLEQLTTDERVVPLYRNAGFRYIVAAAVLLMIVAGVYLLWSSGGKPPVGPAVALVKHDVAAPSKAHAVITLANGQQIAVDSAGNGMLARQGKVKVVKLADGQLAYTGQDREVYYNTLSNPRGSRAITLILPDGTKVWINAASSLRYPTAFTGSERKVEVTGEAYFEVQKNLSQPFKVSIPGKEAVEVLGTSFNVNAYPDEPEIRTTLLEGSIKVRGEPLVGVNTNKNKLSVVLKP
jgi:transmembrane sensor